MGSNAPPWRRLYPFESRFLDRGGVRYHYLDEGAGEPVVMVHGNPTWSFYFRELVKALSRRTSGTHRCIVPDHIGCGLSDKPGDEKYDYCLKSRVDDLEALLEHLGVEANVTLVVHDWGGMIGMAWALRRPERVARLVVMNTAAFLMPQVARKLRPAGTPAATAGQARLTQTPAATSGKRLPVRLRLARGRTGFSALAVRGLNLFARGAARMATAKCLSPEVRAGLLAPYDSWANRIAVLRFVQDIPLSAKDRSYALAKWVDEHLHLLADRPTLICWGERDFVFDMDYLAEWRRRFPRAEVHSFPDAGHYVLEDAGKEIIDAIVAFLSVRSACAVERPCHAH